jgi:hypothetical protein
LATDSGAHWSQPAHVVSGTIRDLFGHHQQKDLVMLGFVAAVLFVIAFLINATSTSTSAVFSPTSLLLVGLASLALHLAGVGTGWSVPGRRSRR